MQCQDVQRAAGKPGGARSGAGRERAHKPWETGAVLAWTAFARAEGTDCFTPPMLNETLCTPTLALGGRWDFFPCCGRFRGTGAAAGSVGWDALTVRASVPQQEREGEGSRHFLTLSVCPVACFWLQLPVQFLLSCSNSPP